MRHLADRSNRLAERFPARTADEPPDTDQHRACGALLRGGAR